MLFDFQKTRIDECITLKSLAEAFSFLNDILSTEFESVTLPLEAGSARDILDAYWLVREYNVNPEKCQRPFDASFLRIVKTCDFLGARFARDDSCVVPLEVLTSWLETASLATFHELLQQHVPNPYESVTKMYYEHMWHFNRFEKVQPNPENKMWRADATLPFLPAFLRDDSLLTETYDMCDQIGETFQTAACRNDIAHMMLSVLTSEQLDRVQHMWMSQKSVTNVRVFFERLRDVLTRERGSLLDKIATAHKNERILYRRVHTTLRELETLHALMYEPSDESFQQMLLVGTYRARATFVRNLVPNDEKPTIFSMHNQESMHADVHRLEALLKKRRSVYNDAKGVSRGYERLLNDIDEWLMRLVEAASTEQYKHSFFEQTSIAFQLQYVVRTILDAFGLSDACQSDVLHAIQSSHEQQKRALSLQMYTPLYCDYPTGCKHSSGRPSIAKQIQLHDENDRLVCLESGTPVVWRFGLTEAQKQHAVMDWNANIEMLMHTRKDGVRGLKKVARCGHHGGGRNGTFLKHAKKPRHDVKV